MSTADKDRLKFTYEDYVLFPDDGRRHEIIDGDHFVNPAPSTYHQTVSKRVQHFLYTKIELAGLGTVFNAPIDLQLSDFDIVQPDLLVIKKESQARITPSRIFGPPELVVEILSPSSIHSDSHLKRKLYEKAGVNEYWIFDPAEQSTQVFRLVDGKYAESETSPDELTVAAFEGVTIPLSEIW